MKDALLWKENMVVNNYVFCELCFDEITIQLLFGESIESRKFVNSVVICISIENLQTGTFHRK